jgi:hypothetical protein
MQIYYMFVGAHQLIMFDPGESNPLPSSLFL